MSQSSVATTVARRAPARRTRASLEVVTPTDRAGSAWFPVLCFALLVAGLGAVLGLNTSMAQDSFEVTALEARSASLADKEDSLSQTINDRAAPQRLATEADALGMVPAGSAAFIDVDKGNILGVASVAKKPDGFTVGAAATATADQSSTSSSPSSKSTSEPSSKAAEKKTPTARPSN